MNNNIEQIDDLLIEKITGTITASDEVWIDNLLATDTVVLKKWVALKEKFDTEKTKKYIDNLDSKAKWLNLKQQLTQNKTTGKVVYLRWLSVAATLFLLGFAVFYHIHTRQTDKHAQVAAVASTGVQLSIGNHQMVNLSAKGGTINVGRLRFSNNEKKLSYTPAQNEAINWITLSVPVKLDYRVTLADGTEVWLNAASSLKFPSGFTGKYREVYLEGEGFFKVAKNKDFPFIVHTLGADVKVLGTTFNIDAYHPQSMVTSLVEGKVLLSAKPGEHYLVPGHQAILNNNGYTDQLFNEDQELGWMAGEEYFNNMSLTAIAEVLQRWYDVKMIVDDASARNLRLSGVIYKNKPLQLFLSSLETSSGIKTTVIDNTIHIFK